MGKVSVVAILSAVLLLVTSCDKDPFSPSVTVRYKVSGTAEIVNIDYYDSNGDLAILTNVESPWEITFTANNGDELFLFAQRVGETGTVSVTIYADGVVLDEELSSGSAGATAQGTL